MKKVLSLLLALAMVFAFAACGETETVGEGVVNPMVEYESLEELNDAYGFNMKKPPVMGVSDESFAAIEVEGNAPIAQYKFSVNGKEFTMRASSRLDDISGVYTGKSTIFADIADGEPAVVATENYRAARWFTIDGQYCLTTEAEGTSAEVFEGIVEELEEIMIAKALELLPDIDQILGNFQDEVSQRAVMDIQVDPDNEDQAIVYISWGSSALEHDLWTMTVSFSEDGLLSYVDGTHERITASETEGEEETVEVLGENLAGFFTFDEETGSLSWDGAPEEDCRECVFKAF